MTFDTMKTWHAMNCVENAVALGYNDCVLTTEDKNYLHKFFRERAERTAASRKPETAKVEDPFRDDRRVA